MMRSLSSGVAGLRAHQTKMDVIGTNIANVNTYGFKSSRVTFSDVYYQTLSSGSAPSDITGGTNPTQIGYGAAVATIDVMNTQSGLASTDRALDLYINGDGMVAVKDANGNLFYTRLGVTGFDAAGNLVDANGNFIMGFPMGADGNPVINPDGTVDVDNLSKISVDKDLLDQMTNISIGTTGEITGTLAGDTEISVSKKKPDWLIDVEIDPESNVVGDVKVVMEFITSTNSPMPADWITAIEAKTNSQISGKYKFAYDPDTKVITATSDQGNVLSGTYKKGATIDMTDASGKVMMTLTTDKYANPGTTPLADVDFSVKQMLAVEYNDKGGNRTRQDIEYDLVATEVTLGDIKLIIDPESAKEVTTLQLAYLTGNQFATGTDPWLLGATLDPNSSYSAKELKLAAGVSQTVAKSYSGNSFNNIMDSNAVEQIIKAINKPGQYKISTVDETPPTNGFRLVIRHSDGTEVKSEIVTKADDDVKFIVGSDTITVGKAQAEHFSATADADVGDLALSDKNVEALLKTLPIGSGYKIRVTEDTASPGSYQVDILDSASSVIASTASNIADGDEIKINGVTLGTLNASQFTSGTPSALGTVTRGIDVSNSNLASMTEKNVLQLQDETGAVLEEVLYNGSNTVKLGDLNIKVDRENLLKYFSDRNKLEANVVSMGEVSQQTTKDWLFDNAAANAQPGIGKVVNIGNIALAKIPNMVAMEQSGSSYFVTTANSGEAIFVRPGINGTGTLKSGYLEMSNVDVSKEFTDMITTQRGFQANTRIITVSDEMLNELVNLKR